MPATLASMSRQESHASAGVRARASRSSACCEKKRTDIVTDVSMSELARRSRSHASRFHRRIRVAALRTWRRSIAPLARETDGSIFAEYTTLLVLVTLGAAAATVSLGIPLIQYYRYVQMIIVVPFP
jgi:hypothetical protein